MTIYQLNNILKIKKQRKRVGRGIGSYGAYSGRGVGGQTKKEKTNREKGQFPSHLRISKVGFVNKSNKKKYKTTVTLKQIYYWLIKNKNEGNIIINRNFLLNNIISSKVKNNIKIKVIKSEFNEQQLQFLKNNKINIKNYPKIL